MIGIMLAKRPEVSCGGGGYNVEFRGAETWNTEVVQHLSLSVQSVENIFIQVYRI